MPLRLLVAGRKAKTLQDGFRLAGQAIDSGAAAQKLARLIAFTNKACSRMILSRILEHKKAELRHKQSRGYLSELKAQIQDAPGPLGFATLLEATKTAGSPSLVAEVKKASPSLGLLRPDSLIGSIHRYCQALSCPWRFGAVRLNRQGFFPGESRPPARDQTIGAHARLEQRVHGR